MMNNKKMNREFSCFSRRIQKRGISAVVATVLIILITVAAVTIIWAAIIPMINDQLSKGTICLDAVSQVSLVDAGYTCIVAGGENISLQIKRGAKEIDLAGVQVLVSALGATTSYTISSDLPGANEEKVFLINVTDTTNVDRVQIAPIVNIGNTEESCDVSASRALLAC
ncbi:MAG: hypothetical protein ABIF18_03950 [archaeon]